CAPRAGVSGSIGQGAGTGGGESGRQLSVLRWARISGVGIDRRLGARHYSAAARCIHVGAVEEGHGPGAADSLSSFRQAGDRSVLVWLELFGGAVKGTHVDFDV